MGSLCSFQRTIANITKITSTGLALFVKAFIGASFMLSTSFFDHLGILINFAKKLHNMEKYKNSNK
jgi:hypothetical protein